MSNSLYLLDNQSKGDTSGKKSKKEAVQKPEVAPELVVKPRRQFTDEGANAKFKASFDGSSNTSLFWSKDGNVLSGDDHIKIYEADGFHFLEVVHVLAEDSGIYTVTVQNLAGSDSASADLEVFVKPKLLSKSGPEWEQPLVDILVNEGDEGIELTCITRDLTKPIAKWFHNGKEVFSGFHMKLSHVAQTTTLTIKQVRKSDAGEFRCVMAGANDTLETSSVLTVKGEDDVDPPAFVRELHDLEVQEGDKLELEVEVKGTKPIEVFWFHNNVEITRENPHFLLASLGHVHTLTLPCATSESSGEYVCEAYNDCGDTDTFCLIDVKEVEHPEAPEFVSQTRTLNCHEGQSATFTCHVKGQPMPTVMWEKGGVVLSPCRKYKMTQIKDQHTLTVFDIEPADAGEYICHLRNMVGEKASSSVLNIKLEETAQQRAEAVSKLKSRLNHLRELHSRTESTDHNNSAMEVHSRTEPADHNSSAMELRSRTEPADHNSSAMHTNTYAMVTKNSAMDTISLHVQVAPNSDQASNVTSPRDKNDVTSPKVDMNAHFSSTRTFDTVDKTRTRNVTRHELDLDSKIGLNESYVSNSKQSPSWTRENILQGKGEVESAFESKESNSRTVSRQTQLPLKGKDSAPTRLSEIHQNSPENKLDFRSLLHKSQKPDEKIRRKENSKQEEVTDFRSVLKSKQRPNEASHASSQTRPKDLDFREVLSKSKARQEEAVTWPPTKSKEAETTLTDRYSRKGASHSVHPGELTSSLPLDVDTLPSQHNESAFRATKIVLTNGQRDESIHPDRRKESRQRMNPEQCVSYSEDSVSSDSVSSDSQGQHHGLTDSADSQEKYMASLNLEISSSVLPGDYGTVGAQGQYKAVPVELLAAPDQDGQSHVYHSTHGSESQQAAPRAFSVTVLSPGLAVQVVPPGSDGGAVSVNFSDESRLLKQQPQQTVEKKVSYISTNASNEFPNIAPLDDQNSTSGHVPSNASPKVEKKVSYIEFQPKVAKAIHVSSSVIQEPRTFSTRVEHLKSSGEDIEHGAEGSYEEYDDVFSETSGTRNLSNNDTDTVDEKEDFNSMTMHEAVFAGSLPKHIDLGGSQNFKSDSLRRQHRSTDDIISDNQVNCFENSRDTTGGGQIFGKKSSDMPDRARQNLVLTHKSVGDDGRAEFKFVKLKSSARKPFNAPEVNRSKNLSKSTESLFLNVKLKPVSQMKDADLSRSQILISSDPEGIKAKSKSSDFSDLPDMTGSPRTRRRFPLQTTQDPPKITQPGYSKSGLDKTPELEPRKAVPVDKIADNELEQVGEKSKYVGVGLEEKVTVALTPKYREEINEDMTLTQGGLNKNKTTSVLMGGDIQNQRQSSSMLPVERKTLGAVGKSMSNDDILGNIEKSNKGPSWVKLGTTEKRFSLQIDQSPMPSHKSVTEPKGRQSLISNYQEASRTSQKWRSKGNLDLQSGDKKANNFESKKELFEKLEQGDNMKTQLRKTVKGVGGGRLATGGRHDMSPRRSSGVVKRYSGHHEAKPEWLNRKPVKNIEQKIGEADKGRRNVSTAPWVKDITRRDLKQKVNISENHKVVETTDKAKPLDQKGSRQTVETTDKAKPLDQKDSRQTVSSKVPQTVPPKVPQTVSPKVPQTVSPKVPPPVAPKPAMRTSKFGRTTQFPPLDGSQPVNTGDASENGDKTNQPAVKVVMSLDHKMYSPDNFMHSTGKADQSAVVTPQVSNVQALQEASAEPIVFGDDYYKASVVILTPVSNNESPFTTSDTQIETLQKEDSSSRGRRSPDLNQPWRKQRSLVNLDYPPQDKDTHEIQDNVQEGQYNDTPESQEVLRSSMEDLESVISVSSTASEVSNVTNDSNYSSEDTCRTSVIEQLHLNETMRLSKIQERLDQNRGTEPPSKLVSDTDDSVPKAPSARFHDDQILHKRDESSSSQDSGLILDGALKSQVAEVVETEIAHDKSRDHDKSQDHDTSDDIPLRVRRGRKFVDQEHETLNTSRAGRSDYSRNSSVLKTETSSRKPGSNLEKSERFSSHMQQKLEEPKGQDRVQQKLEEPKGQDRVQQYRSKFRETKNVERVEVISADQPPDLIASTKMAPTSSSAIQADETVEDTLKARLRSKLKLFDYDNEESNPRYEVRGRASLVNRGEKAEDGNVRASHLSRLPLEDHQEDPSWKSKTEIARSLELQEHTRAQNSTGVKRPSDLDLTSSPRSSRLQVRESKNYKSEALQKTEVRPNSSAATQELKINSKLTSQDTVTPTSSTTSTPTRDQPAMTAQPTTGAQPTMVSQRATTAPGLDVQPQCPPSFPLLLADAVVKYGSRATLQCKLAGNPKPDIKWLLNLTPLEASNNVVISYENDTAQLTILETFSEHTGDYMCWAKNPLGSISTHCQLTLEASSKSEGRAFEGPVSLKPRIVSLTPSHARLTKGADLTLSLEFVGEPTATVQWILNGRELQTDGRVEIVTNKSSSQLTIESVGQSDAGTMSVCVSSTIGSDQTQTNIHIEDVPGAPEGKPQVYDISKTSASLSWYPPISDGGSQVTYYVIEAKTRQQTTWDVLVPQCKELSHHILDLKQSTTYQFRVRASNKHGLGPSSEPSDRVITTDPFRPISDEESEGYPEVFTPSIEYRRGDELPFEPRTVTINTKEKFEDLYHLENEVGKGKFGIVYKCKQKKDGTTWAAKIVKCREKDKANIKQEITIMNCLRHPKLLMLWDAFEDPRRVILVMEYVGAGELFERVIGEDFVLTERDCVHFLRQICEGVAYMHGSYILHLDLKPENILCVAENSNRIKIIDFGLARSYKPGESAKVLFGTPEFIAPEVINYDEIGFHTDMWSIGVICYVLLSGLSPFLGDNDVETLSNVTSGEFDFDDDAFDEITDLAKDFISALLVKKKEDRMLTTDCLSHGWLNQDEVDGLRYKRLNTERLKRFMVRRKWMKTGKAILAVGRMRRSTSSNNLSRSSSNDSLLDSCSTTPITELSSESFDQSLSRDETPAAKVKAALPDSTEETNKPLGLRPNDNSLASSSSGNSLAKECKTNTAQNTGTLRDSHAGTHSETKKVLQNSKRDQNDNRVTGNSLNNLDTSRKHKDIKENSRSQDHTLSDLSSASSPASARRNAGKNIPLTEQAQTPEPSGGDNTPLVPCRPVFIKSMKNCKACAGDVARFDVVLSGIPTPVVTWYLEEEEIGQDQRHTLDCNGSTRTFSLIVRRIVEDDEGEYMCKAVNSEGEVTCTAELSVLQM